jgi:hypothetical protein
MTTTNRAQLAGNVEGFILGGNATLTVVGRAARYTYRVRQSKDGAVNFVSVLSGTDNESDYQFIGTLVRGRFFPKGWRDGATPAPSAVAFAWLWNHRANPTPAEVWHEGRCCRCGRKLTVPESIAAGIGPECAQRVA